MDQLELLDTAKAVTGSDYATSKRIGVSRQSLSCARSEIRQLELATIGALAEVCGKDPLRTIAAVAATREGQTKKGRNWRRWSGAAALIMGIATICAFDFQSIAYVASLPFVPLYIMSSYTYGSGRWSRSLAPSDWSSISLSRYGRYLERRSIAGDRSASCVEPQDPGRLFYGSAQVATLRSVK